jgi:eukaryotic-like serine/threonine-protein kinase
VRVPQQVGDRTGCFTVGELLGEGATGAIYAGGGPKGEQVAIKFLHPHLADIPDIDARFRREGRAAGRIRSPYVARVLLAGRTQQGILWIVYERLRGETLEARLSRVQVLPVPVARMFLDHVLAGLEAAHQAEVVHRDIKPLTRLESAERACILDFGLSKYTPTPGHSTSQVPRTSTADEMLGTASYTSPEQTEGAASVDLRTDLYPVGVIAFEMITGELPFEAISPIALVHAKLNTDPRTLTEATGLSWSESAEAFFRVALSRVPAARFQNTREMRRAVDEGMRRGNFPALEQHRARLRPRSRKAVADTFDAPMSSREVGVRGTGP